MNATSRSGWAQSVNSVVDVVRGALADFAERYRKPTRYFRMRVGILGGWVLISLVTLFASCPPSGPTNSLGAIIQVLPRSESLMGTQVLVSNESHQNWTEVTFTLDGEWQLKKKTVRPGDKVVLSLDKFRKEDLSPPPDLSPQSIRIDAAEGQATEKLTRR